MNTKKKIKSKEICKQALKLFAHFGFRKTTLEDVASALGMTKSNIYFYFKNKQELYEASVKLALEEWRDWVKAQIKTASNPVEKFKTVSLASFNYLNTHPELRSILHSDPSIFTLTPQEDRFSGVNLLAKDILRSILKEGQEKGIFYRFPLEPMTEFIFSTYIMFLIRVYVKAEGQELFTVYEQAVELAIRGLSNKEFI